RAPVCSESLIIHAGRTTLQDIHDHRHHIHLPQTFHDRSEQSLSHSSLLKPFDNITSITLPLVFRVCLTSCFTSIRNPNNFSIFFSNEYRLIGKYAFPHVFSTTVCHLF